MTFSLPDKPDHEAVESEILEFWAENDTFAQVRSKNESGPIFSFIDGPVTANKKLGVHTAWGRTLKDVFQRYRAQQGYHLRYQNGFDAQGLWIEVGVEKALGLDSKREIETYGLENFARECRKVVEWSVNELVAGSVRLGQWMDWGNDYVTSSDTNIAYIWRFLQVVHERGWLYKGHRATEWCPRCGTSISAHELIGSYVDLESPSVRVRLPITGRPGEFLVIWTTTPWTLPANVAVAVNVEFEYGRTEDGDWIAVATAPDTPFVEVRNGSELVGWAYDGPFDSLPALAGVEHRVVAWDEVEIGEGTGLVHIAPGCGTSDFELGRREGLAMPTPVDEAGAYYADYGWLAGRAHDDVTRDVLAYLDERGLLVEDTVLTHRYPECWRCHTPLIYRVSDDWFISVAEIRKPMREANAGVEWIPGYMGKRMDDWLVNMADWNISRRRFYGLPLPFYPCSCGHLTVIGSREELAQRAAGSLDGLQELRRPWIDDVTITCPECGEQVRRIQEVGDVWLDAGIVPFSTLGWENPETIPGGLGTGAAADITHADLPDHETWQRWFPADLVSEMREQIRLWFYAQLFISVTLVGQAPYKRVLGYEKLLAEDGREMHGSWGNMIQADEAFAVMGADVMRWLYCSQPSNQDLLFGFARGKDVKRGLLTLWNSALFYVQNSAVNSLPPAAEHLALDAVPMAADVDRWMVERTHAFVEEARAAYEAYASSRVITAAESFVDDLSNWYIRLSRRRFWNGDHQAHACLYAALTTYLRVVGPVVPFLAEYLWQRLVVEAVADAPASVFLAGWPVTREPDRGLLAEMEATRRVVELGRQARADAKQRVRQPLARAVVEGAAGSVRFTQLIQDELRVKAVEFGEVASREAAAKPNFRRLGKRLGPAMRTVAAAIARGEYEDLPDGGVLVAGEKLEPEDVIRESSVPDGWVVAAGQDAVVGLDVRLTDTLILEGRANDLIRAINNARKERGLEITDRIRLTLPHSAVDLEGFLDTVAKETLAVEVSFSDVAEQDFVFAKVEA